MVDGGKKALSFAKNNNIIIWNLIKAQKILNIDEPGVSALDISDDGSLIVLGKTDGNIVFLDQFRGAEDFKKKEIIKVSFSETLTL